MSTLLKAIYNDTTIELREGTSPEQAKSILSRLYPELANATAEVVGDTVHFKVQAGTKGAALFAVYNDTRIELREGTSVEQAKEILSRLYPELANSTAELDGDVIRFKVQSGTKGAALFAVYNDTRIELREGTSVEQAKEILSRLYPELANATAEIDGDVIRFKVQAGTKGV